MQDLIIKNKLHWQVASAGTNGYHNGEAPHRLSQKVALLHDIDISKQISRKLIPSDIKEFDLIFAMAHDVFLDIKNIFGKNYDSEKVKLFLSNGNDVPDPWYGAEDGYHTVYDIIEKECKTIIEVYNN